MALPGLAGTGAAIGYFVSALVVFIVTRMTLRRLLGSSLNPKIGLHMIAAGLAGGAAFVLSQFIAIHGLIALIAYALLILALFAGILWAVKELTRQDVRYFLDVVNIKEMRNYISSEMGKKRTQP